MNRKFIAVIPLSILIFALLMNVSSPALADTQRGIVPECFIFSEFIELNTEKALNWKKENEHGFLSPVRLQGIFLKYYTYEGIQKFQIQIGPRSRDTIMVSYVSPFSELPKLHRGDKIEACGLFVIDKRLSDKAQVYNTSSSSDAYHTDGFLIVNGKYYD